MHSNGEKGVALISAIMVLMLMSAMVTGFLVMVNADQAAGGITRDQTQAYAAAHAGLEKLTSDLGALFVGGNYSPSTSDLEELMDDPPVLPGFTFESPNGESGYVVTPRETTWRSIPSGPYQGLTGLITPYEITVTARSAGAEVRTRRELQTVGIPVFQFGIFSENDLSFFAGPNFNFGGRVHTNQNLWLKQDGDAILTLSDRVTAVGEVIRTHLANGQTTHGGCVRVTTDPGSSNYRFLGRNSGASPATSCSGSAACSGRSCEGSLLGTIGSSVNPDWEGLSTGPYARNIMNGRTGARRLDLPLVSAGAQPIDIIRRPPVGEASNSDLGRQRFYNMATLRILLSDQASDLTGLPGVVYTAGTTPLRLAGDFTAASVDGGISTAVTHRFAESSGTLNEGYRTTSGTPSLDGYILINRQDRDGNWTDVTKEVLSLGFAGKRLSNGTLDMVDINNSCLDVHPNAILRFQRVRDGLTGSTNCPTSISGGYVPPTSATAFWPNVLYDPREGMLRDDQGARPTVPSAFGSSPNNAYAGQQRLYWGGVMHYVELDVKNLRKWLRDEIGSSNSAACINGAGPDTCPMDVTGFVVYFSDRRGNRNRGSDGNVETNYDVSTGFAYTDDAETGEFGFEDNINPSSSISAPNGSLDGAFVDVDGTNRYAEDLNANGTIETYGGEARLLNAPTNRMMNVTTNAPTPVNNEYRLFATSTTTSNNRPIDRNVARVNRAFFFRRALKLVNGGRGNLPANGSQGLTVASENPVYVQGNYNACTDVLPSGGNFTPACIGAGFGTNVGTDHVSAAVIADAVTFLSNAWNDIRSFVNPHNAGITGLTHVDSSQGNRYDARQAVTTWYRLGIIAGKGLNFTRPTTNSNDHTDFGTDGGAHNFIRYIENWDGATLNYRGSLISFFTSRQAVGVYKCCDIVYSAPSRGFNFDDEFLNPNLLPPRTPMFRDINTLTFRQILRPTQ